MSVSSRVDDYVRDDVNTFNPKDQPELARSVGENFTGVYLTMLSIIQGVESSNGPPSAARLRPGSRERPSPEGVRHANPAERHLTGRQSLRPSEEFRCSTQRLMGMNTCS